MDYSSYINTLIAFISANGVCIATFIVNTIVGAVRAKRSAKKSPSYANIELKMMQMDAKLDRIEKKVDGGE